MKRVVVTGYGIVCPLGNSVEEFSRRMFAGESGIVNIRGTLVDANFPVPYAGLVNQTGLPLPEVMKKLPASRQTNFWKYATGATEQAIKQLRPGKDKVDAVVYGTAEGVSFELLQSSFRLADQGKLKVSREGDFDWDLTRSEMSLELISQQLQSLGLGQLPESRLISINSACATGNQAIGIALERIRRGEWNRAVVGGVDARCTASNLMNFYMLGALTTADVPAAEASRPFAKDRSGFVRGEGAATLVMETLESAQERGATIYGEVVGYSLTSDAFRLTDGRDDGSAVVRAMKDAIFSAGMTPDQIDYVNAHGTSTPLNDRLETKATLEVFGDRAKNKKLPVSSLKSQVGHSTVAAGAMEAVASLLMLQAQRLAPTINYKVVDPECDLDVVPNQSRDAKVETVLSNNFGFGGQNACLVFKRYHK